jgi:hypothetical protein
LETMCVEKGWWQKNRIDTGINITIFIIGLLREIWWGNYPCKTTSDVVHLMFISILGQRHLTERRDVATGE